MGLSGGKSVGERKGGRAPIAALAMGEYVERLARGENHREAALGAGYSRNAFFRLRRRDPEFAAACDEAVSRSSGKRFIHGTRKRNLQLRRNRRTLFTTERQDVFLSQFATSGNREEAAAQAGVCVGTIDRHRRENPDFERRFGEVLDQVYEKLEADLVAARVAAQRRALELEPTAGSDVEFDRALRLLQRWDRNRERHGRAGRQVAFRWDFAETLTLLEKKLRNMGIPILPLPPGHDRPDGDLPLPPSGPREGEVGEGGDEREGGA
jgi:hypothetical protein